MRNHAPRTEPWGTPDFTDRHIECDPLTTTLCLSHD